MLILKLTEPVNLSAGSYIIIGKLYHVP